MLDFMSVIALDGAAQSVRSISSNQSFQSFEYGLVSTEARQEPSKGDKGRPIAAAEMTPAKNKATPIDESWRWNISGSLPEANFRGSCGFERARSQPALMNSIHL